MAGRYLVQGAVATETSGTPLSPLQPGQYLTHALPQRLTFFAQATGAGNAEDYFFNSLFSCATHPASSRLFPLQFFTSHNVLA